MLNSEVSPHLTLVTFNILSDVLCGQINLHRGIASATQLRSYLSTQMHTVPTQQHVEVDNEEAHMIQMSKICGFLTFLQEPPTTPKRVVGFSPNNHLFYDASADRPRTAIYASKNLNLWPVSEYTDRDITTCLWKRQNERNVYVASAYMDIQDNEVISSKLLKLLQYCQRKNFDLLICADTNAHSSLWNCDETNRRGLILEDISSVST